MRLNSWKDFRHAFGGFLPYSYLAYAVRGFFASGGESCYVARVGVAQSPPATAVIPLPAAITAVQIANVSNMVSATNRDSSLDAAADQTQVQFDAPVALTISSVIAVGGAALSLPLTVTSVIDSQSYIVHPPVEAAQVGSPVFALSGPAVATPVTSMVMANLAGESQIKLDSSDVNGIAQGSLIAIGDPLTGECVLVTTIHDDQQITVQPALSLIHPSGAPVYPVAGSALTTAAAQGATSLKVMDVSAFAADDLVSVEGGGVREIRVVTAQTAASALELGLPLNFSYAAGAIVRKYTAALTVSAYSPGVWGNRIRLTIKPLDDRNAATRFSMLVTVAPGDDPTQPMQQEFYPLLSLDPYDPYPLTSADSSVPPAPPGSFMPKSSAYVVTAVNSVSQLIRVNAPVSPPGVTQRTQLLVNSGPLQTNDLYLEGGYDGAPGITATVSAAPSKDPCSMSMSIASRSFGKTGLHSGSDGNRSGFL